MFNLNRRYVTRHSHIFAYQSGNLKRPKQRCNIITLSVVDELSMDPRVRTSPWADPPENEVKVSFSDAVTIRRRRIFFILIHLMALVALYYCVIGRVSVYTMLWGKHTRFGLVLTRKRILIEIGLQVCF